MRWSFIICKREDAIKGMSQADRNAKLQFAGLGDFVFRNRMVANKSSVKKFSVEIAERTRKHSD